MSNDDLNNSFTTPSSTISGSNLPVVRGDLVSVVELAREFQKSVRTINRQIASGDLPAPFYLGVRKFWTRSKLTKFFELRQGEAEQKSEEKHAEMRHRKAQLGL